MLQYIDYFLENDLGMLPQLLQVQLKYERSLCVIKAIPIGISQ